MQVFIDTFHILEGDLLPQHHLVECSNEERVEETTMKDGETDNAANKFEIIQMFGINAGVRINLQGVIIVRGIFE